ncbi:GntR family transcriptional regulator [Caenimonas sp. SL110]|uniref:GntR family transcriptional regulator n=1 Tax=Caenimonas sp. SL110 TaxID=1450524 RepID=UPI000653395E|nr:GntR family transcriptional regulator [Caenimonas sp. SL110]
MRYRPAPHGLQPIAASGPGPLFRQARRELQRVIESGRYGPGEALPSETVIAQAMGVSIGTLRKAVDELVHENILVRRQGKGTFVAQHNDARFLFQFFHVEPRGEFPTQGEIREQEYPQVDCVGFARVRSDEAEAAALRINRGDPVWRIDNRLSLGGRAVVHDRIAISAALFSRLTERLYLERTGTIYSLYQTEFGITVLRAHERARANASTRETARILGVAEGMPMLEVHRLALTFGDKPVEYRVSTINTAAHDYVSLLAKRGQVMSG